MKISTGRFVAYALLSLATLTAHAQSETGRWQQALEQISSGVVSIRVDVARSFDTERAQSSQATGFVVDAEKGLILTNRHVVTPGPVRAEALFLNQEEVALTPIYRDPVHDFGLFRYDPSKLKYITPHELKLNPAGARVGTSIRVVGNDAGEQLSILSGTIARLQRRAPQYGLGKYNDFNTFYLQAASGTSGGSSGSPVINIDGEVVALNAGGSAQAASSFFLPLDRIHRAVELLRNDQPVSRGTLETTFVQLAFDELVRLGLQESTEAAVRKADADQVGMLVAAEVVPASPAYGALKVGDILVAVNGESIRDFVTLADILDSSVGQEVTIEVERNGQPVALSLPVTNLHSITPDEYIRFSDALVHNLSYQMARHYNRPIEGVFVASSGYALASSGLSWGSLIVELDGKPVNNIDEFEAVLDTLADGQEAAARFFTLEDPQVSKLRTIRMDRHWFAAERCQRDDGTGFWACRELADGPAALAEEPGSARFIRYDEAIARKVAPSLVQVKFDMPYTVSGISDQHYYGTGIIVDAERGLVAVDRNTVPEAMGDVRITIASSLEVPGKVEYIHPLHNLAMLSYDPALLGDTPVKSIRLKQGLPKPGAKLTVVGLRSDDKLIHRTTEVASIEPAVFPLSNTIRFRDTNLETIALVNGPSEIDGVIVDRSGAAVALWSSFAFQGGAEVRQISRGLPAEQVQDLLEYTRGDKSLHSLEVEVMQMPLSVARNFGLPDEWASSIEAHDPERRQVLVVARTVAGTPAAESLRNGDLILGIDGKPVTRFRELEQATSTELVEVTVLRDKQVVTTQVATVQLSGAGTRRGVYWGGALLQEPYRDMAAQRNIELRGTYVAFFAWGSPASRYGLGPGMRIVEVDGQPVPDLDAFLELVKDKKDRDSVRLTTVSWNGNVSVLTLKIDDVYWPAYEISYQDDQWQRNLLAN